MFGSRGRGGRRHRPDAEAEADEAAGAIAGRVWRGPYDLDDAPGDGIHRIDLGSLAVPVPAGVTVDVLPAVDAPPAVGVPLAADGLPVVGVLLAEREAVAVVTAGRAVLTIVAYAAPKSRGLWDDVRAGLAAAVPPAVAPAELAEVPADPAADASPGVPGAFAEVVGECGPELRLTVAVGEQPWQVRVLGFDGPRWFLRATLAAPVTAMAEADVLLAAVLRRVIVLRGTRAVPSGAALPLRRPAEHDDELLVGLLGLAGTEPAVDEQRTPAAATGEGARRDDVTGRVNALHDALDEALGRVRPTGTLALDARGLDFAPMRAPIAGLGDVRLIAWG